MHPGSGRHCFMCNAKKTILEFCEIKRDWVCGCDDDVREGGGGGDSSGGNKISQRDSNLNAPILSMVQHQTLRTIISHAPNKKETRAQKYKTTTTKTMTIAAHIATPKHTHTHTYNKDENENEEREDDKNNTLYYDNIAL